ncbi:hypothetical protein Q0M94_22935 (plasmid) [Deinococcus radiomollis]|uniref:hypothetical protein n=1 Tax=Deinococcus radiomollis TaxID=468916 RepID=UPI003891AD5B
MSESLEARFEKALLADAEAVGKIDYDPRRFKLMIRQKGGVETARTLLQPGAASYGFEVLREKGHLELSMEALLVQAPWRALFSDEELMTAMERLWAGGYIPALN